MDPVCSFEVHEAPKQQYPTRPMQDKNTLTLIVAASLLVAMSACSRPYVEIEEPTESLVFETIGVGQRGFVADTLETVVNDSLVWSEMSGNLSPLEPFKPVDFSQAMVGLIAMRVESGGYAIEVESVEFVEGEIVVSYVLYEPGSDCIALMADALAFQAVTIRRTEGDVRFVRRNESYKCTIN